MNQYLVAPNVAWAAFAAVCALGASTLVRLIALHRQPPDIVASRIQSLKTWWFVIGVVVVTALIGPVSILGLLVVVSLLSLREFAAFPWEPRVPRRVLWSGYVVVLASYTVLMAGLTRSFVSVTPLLVVAVPSVVVILSGQATCFTQHTGRSAWVLLVTTYGLGHLGLLALLPQESNPPAGPVGLYLFVAAITELNDIVAALVGRRLGHRKLNAISPKKTWEGLAGGMVAAAIASVLLGQWLTAMTVEHLIAVGLLLSVAGSLGDLNMSAVKRDAGIKDSGSLLPEHGGILDRIDSLTFTAPLFYYYWQWCSP